MTGARQGKNSRLFMAVNNSEMDQTVTVDFRPYRFDSGRITCYRLINDRLTVEKVHAEHQTKVSFEPGETRIWLFKPAEPTTSLGAKDTDAPGVRWISPSSRNGLFGKVRIRARATDNREVEKIRLLIDGQRVDTDRGDKLVYRWKTGSLKDGSTHRITIKAYDAAGNVTVRKMRVSLA